MPICCASNRPRRHPGPPGNSGGKSVTRRMKPGWRGGVKVPLDCGRSSPRPRVRRCRRRAQDQLRPGSTCEPACRNGRTGPAARSRNRSAAGSRPGSGRLLNAPTAVEDAQRFLFKAPHHRIPGRVPLPAESVDRRHRLAGRQGHLPHMVPTLNRYFSTVVCDTARSAPPQPSDADGQSTTRKPAVPEAFGLPRPTRPWILATRSYGTDSSPPALLLELLLLLQQAPLQLPPPSLNEKKSSSATCSLLLSISKRSVLSLPSASDSNSVSTALLFSIVSLLPVLGETNKCFPPPCSTHSWRARYTRMLWIAA